MRALLAGPLGTGISNAVGIAATEAHMSARFNKADAPDVIDHYTYALQQGALAMPLAIACLHRSGFRCCLQGLCLRSRFDSGWA